MLIIQVIIIMIMLILLIILIVIFSVLAPSVSTRLAGLMSLCTSAASRVV